MKKTIASLKAMKAENHKIAMLTVYDYSTAVLMDRAGLDMLLVGDSLGMVMLGYDDTLPVTMEDMIHHAKAVAKAAKTAFVVADLPFMSYQTSVYDAVFNAGRLVKETGAQAVKLEGGTEICPQIKAINEAGIPVMGHLGLTPQSVNTLSGFKVQAKEKESATKLIEDGKALEKAGVFSIVLECVPAELAQILSECVSVPTVGIGAGAGCDGQVLVMQDMLDIYSNMKPKFVKRFGSVGQAMSEAFKAYIDETKDGTFPSEEHTFKIDYKIIEELKVSIKGE